MSKVLGGDATDAAAPVTGLLGGLPAPRASPPTGSRSAAERLPGDPAASESLPGRPRPARRATGATRTCQWGAHLIQGVRPAARIAPRDAPRHQAVAEEADFSDGSSAHSAR